MCIIYSIKLISLYTTIYAFCTLIYSVFLHVYILISEILLFFRYLEHILNVKASQQLHSDNNRCRHRYVSYTITIWGQMTPEIKRFIHH